METFVSSGVYTRERDFSFYASAIGNSALALIGETKKGPAFMPTLVTNTAEFEELFGMRDPNMQLPYCVRSYFKYANQAYIVRVLGDDSLRTLASTKIIKITAWDEADDESKVIATLLGGSSESVAIEDGGDATGLFGFTADTIGFSGSVTITDKTSPNYIGTLFPRDSVITENLAVQHVFANQTTASLFSATTGASITTMTTADPLGAVDGYTNAISPLIVADVPDGVEGGNGLFTINTISDGVGANNQIKISIENINASASTFDLLVRDIDDTNASQIVFERYNKLSMDKTNKNYILKAIGDSRDETGDFTLISKYIYITVEVGDHANKVPAGFNGINVPQYWPEFRMNTAYSSSLSNGKQSMGLNYTVTDDDQLMIGASSQWDLTTTGNTIMGFHLNKDANPELYICGGLSSFTEFSTAKLAKFVVPVLGGNDGWKRTEATRDYLGETMTVNDVAQWKAGLDTIANPEEFDINLLAVPGIDISSSVGDYAISLAETRADCLYIGDMPNTKTSATGAGTVGVGIDSSYVATYWPYITVYDPDNEQNVTIPPTSRVLEAISYTDLNAHPWFAPAGMNRGLLTDVIRAEYKLSQDDRDELAENKINPIATYPGQGIAIWGQRTLQTRDSALDRINVRRMMLHAEKVIATASKFLVFEQNDETTWDRFKGMVNPILDTIRIKRGIEEFRVIMDETTNTPDMIDRNQMVGQIYIKPTKSAEVILINFNLLAQGASFEES